MTLWNKSGKLTAGEADGGTAQLPPPLKPQRRETLLLRLLDRQNFKAL